MAQERGIAEARFARWQKWLVIGLAIAGAAVGGFAGKELAYVFIGLVIGALLGGMLHKVLVHSSATSAADKAYLHAWCAHHGLRPSAATAPGNAPYAKSGHRQRTFMAIEGERAGLQLLFYNFSYWTKSGSGKDQSETEHRHRILRLTGVQLPITRLTIHERGFMNRFATIDKLQGAVTRERPISLESVAFNEKYDLTIDDTADEIWIRRIFDPATIAAVINGQLHIPDLRYYDGAWWLVEDAHLDEPHLDVVLNWHAEAAAAIEHLSRVQTL